jgi:hypothetical protein
MSDEIKSDIGTTESNTLVVRNTGFTFGEGVIVTIIVILMVWTILLAGMWRGDINIQTIIVTAVCNVLSAVAGYWYGTRGQTSKTT